MLLALKFTLEEKTRFKERAITTPSKTVESSLIIVALIVFIDMCGIGLILPVLPTLIQSMQGSGVAGAAEWGGLLLFSYATMQFVCAPVIGGLSDRYGRRPVLLITLFVLALDYAIMAWAPTITWLFVGRIISGAMGASWTAANSCVADVATQSNRAKYFGWLGGAGAAGFVMGPAIGGILGQYNDRLPFVAASVIAFVGVLAGYVWLKETLNVDHRRQFSIRRANPFGNLLQMRKTPFVLGVLGVIFLLQLASQTQLAVWPYYVIERFAWSELHIGLLIALYGVMIAFMQGFMTDIVIKRLGEIKTAFYSMLIGFPAYLMVAFAPDGKVIVFALIYGSVGALAFPPMQAMMSARVAEDAQGELQGAIASAIGLTSIVGPVVFTVMFRYFADGVGIYFPGAPFLLAAVFCVVAVLLYWRTIRQ